MREYSCDEVKAEIGGLTVTFTAEPVIGGVSCMHNGVLYTFADVAQGVAYLNGNPLDERISRPAARVLAASPAAAAGAVVAECEGCGKKFSLHEFRLLALVGVMDVRSVRCPQAELELRNCGCHSTVAISIDENGEIIVPDKAA